VRRDVESGVEAKIGEQLGEDGGIGLEGVDFGEMLRERERVRSDVGADVENTVPPIGRYDREEGGDVLRLILTE
jgi:hypothetical protein